MRGHLSSRIFSFLRSEFSNFAQYLHYGNLICPCHEHHRNCPTGHLVHWCNLHQCQVCCDKHQGKALGNVMRALTETKVILILFAFLWFSFFMVVDQWPVALLHLAIIKLTHKNWILRQRSNVELQQGLWKTAMNPHSCGRPVVSKRRFAILFVLGTITKSWKICFCLYLRLSEMHLG